MAKRSDPTVETADEPRAVEAVTALDVPLSRVEVVALSRAEAEADAAVVTPELPSYADGYATAIADVLALLDERIARGPAGEQAGLKDALAAVLTLVS